VTELAARFADGRLSAEKLSSASDEELAELLIEVRGVGMVCLMTIIGYICLMCGSGQARHLLVTKIVSFGLTTHL
jgi:hypothetical protein